MLLAQAIEPGSHGFCFYLAQLMVMQAAGQLREGVYAPLQGMWANLCVLTAGVLVFYYS